MSDDQSGLIEALHSPDAYPHETGAIRLIETHISWVLLTGRFAYKLKKAVKLPFLDFSTLKARERFCRDELELNSRLAPEVYLDVVTIGGTADAPRIGATPAIEYAVKMVQFPPESTADRLIEAGGLAADDFRALAERIARFHAELAPATGTPPGDAVIDNLDELAALLGPDAPDFTSIDADLRSASAKLAPQCERRQADGSVRECHGDLHLANIAEIDGRLVPFDCLEFDRELRTMDVIDEVAFLGMDLTAHSRSDLAISFLNRYLELSGDFEGLRLLRFYAAHRALVRAKVALLAQEESPPVRPGARAGRYLETARRELDSGVLPLVIMAGLSGSGKSTVAAGLAPALGAVLARSDVERKRLHAMAPTERGAEGLEEGLYGKEATAATYERLAGAAEAALAGRVPVIVDAAFLSRARRRSFRDLAERAGACFLILHCDAPEATLRERIRARQRRADDPSDADETVLDHQLETAEALDETERETELRVDTEATADYSRLAAAIAKRCQVSLSSTSY